MCVDFTMLNSSLFAKRDSVDCPVNKNIDFVVVVFCFLFFGFFWGGGLCFFGDDVSDLSTEAK